MSRFSQETIKSMWETINALNDFHEHYNHWELRDVIALYQACAIVRGVNHLHDLMLIIDDLAMDNLFNKDTVEDEK